MNHLKTILTLTVGIFILSAPLSAAAEEGVTVVGEGHSRSASFGKVPFESKPKIKSKDPSIATVSWKGEESGSLVITGVKEGTTVVTVTGKVRVTEIGPGAKKILTVKPYKASVTVKVIKSEKYTKMAVIYVKQKMSIKFPKRYKKATPVKNSNRRVVTVTSQTRTRITIRGVKVGESWLTFLMEVKLKNGKKKKVPANILVRVIAGKPKKDKTHVSIGWDDLYIGEVIIVNPPPGMDKHGKPIPIPEKDDDDDEEVGMLQDWPAQDGVYCSFKASGRNYGGIGDITIENATDKPVTVTVPPGLLLDSDTPQVQDLYVADVPTETPCGGAKDIDKPITIAPNASYVIKDVPGFCPDGEKDPPKPETEGQSVYTACKPDEKASTLLDAIAAVKKMDVGKMKLDVFKEDKARAMVCQGTLWQVDSKIDAEPDNDFTSEKLNARFFEAFTASAKEALEKMPETKREKVETVVKDDIKKIVAAADFITKKTTTKSATGKTLEI
ncbi:MAG: hypothetical protein HN350_08955 [Phycisphaerales bacterium]|jgi:hypothetical protein|nr:hypothetical protein [Phycisphaerales bacterium]